MKIHLLRLQAGQDVRAALDAVLADRGVSAAFVVAGIGSLSATRLRYAGAQQPTLIEGDVEILTLSGSLSADGSHLHMSVSDVQGRVIGGHVAAGCMVRTTAEVLVALLPDHPFSRAMDAQSGYAELVVR